MEGSWRVYPLEGALELHYCDQAGNPSTRRIIARELKVGPGKTLLGGIDMADDGYRGFRADRIDCIVDAETGVAVDRNILDWLIKRAECQAKERRKATKAA
jgi:predicted DNA-binding transcriptional regulator YafY